MFGWLILYPAGFVISLFVAALLPRRFGPGRAVIVAASVSALIALLLLAPEFFAGGMHDLGVFLYAIFLVWILGTLGAALGVGLRNIIGR